MKKILICGSNGLVGQHLTKKLNTQKDFDLLHTSNRNSFYLSDFKGDFTQLDITNKKDVKNLVLNFKPDVIVNTVAISNVDFCETEKDTAWKVNALGVENLISAANIINAKLIHLSTDYLFDGKKGDYSETDRINPINYYGKTKHAAENFIISSELNFCILRPVVIFGFGKNLKTNFPFWVIESLRKKNKINCATDQISNPTFANQIADAIIFATKNDLTGIYNLCGETKISRFDLAVKCAKIFKLDENLITPILSSELKQKAPRPLNTTLNISKAKSDFKIEFLEIDKALSKMKEYEKSQI